MDATVHQRNLGPIGGAATLPHGAAYLGQLRTPPHGYV
jgi:hypothetical protein